MRSALLALLASLALAGMTPGNAGAETPLRVGLVSCTFYYLPFWAARDRGFYAAEGLDVSLSVMADTTAQVPALLNGQLDLTVAPTEGIVRNADEGGPLRILAGNSGKLSHFIIAQPRFRRIEDLKGARVGILNLTEGIVSDSDNNRAAMTASGAVGPGDGTVVWMSGPVPLDPIEARAGLPAELAGKLRAAFTGITREQAATIMMPHDTGFAPATDKDYAWIVEDWRQYGSK